MNLETAPKRVVSLVPSLTESLFDLGVGQAVIGVTDYCVRPKEAMTNLPRVGGTKNPRVEDILALNPDLVIANQEENPREVVKRLQAAGVPVWVTFPKTVQGALEVLREMAGLFRSETALAQVRSLETAVELARSAAETTPPVRYFSPIWQDKTVDNLWWMTFNGDTYPSDLLALFGGVNVFAGRQRRYPLEADLGQAQPVDAPGRDTRYPRVTREEVCAAAPEVILLPTEPYYFLEDHVHLLVKELACTPAAQNQHIIVINGSLLNWYGTRLAQALEWIPTVLARFLPEE